MSAAVVGNHYTPANPAVFASLVPKMADKLGASYNQVAYHLTLDPQYYDDDVAKDDFNFADTEYALGISDASLMKDQADAVRKAYGLDDQELQELLASEQHWMDEGGDQSFGEATSSDPEYTVEIERKGQIKSVSGTLSYLIGYFGYTLATGKSYEHEEGRKKINLNPKNIQDLIKNINNAKSNSTTNGAPDTYYSIIA